MARSIERRREGARERERELVLAFQGGDPSAYDSIDHSCRPAAERICRRLLVNPADVEEAVQETMVRAYQGLPRFNGSYALTAWVARIATNVCLDTLRARSRRPQNVSPIDPDMEARNGENGSGNRDPEELVEQVVEAEEVRKVLAELPERHRTALVLREFEGYSHRRIAAMLDTSPERVKALIHRAKAGFKRAWGDDSNGGRLAAFAPLLIPINWVRRFFGRAPEFDYASTTSAASSPVAQTLATVASERVSTALAAVMLAGTVGFAVQSAPSPSRAEGPPREVEIVQVAAPVEPAPKEGIEEPKAKRQRKPEPEESPAVAVLPSTSPEEEAGVELEDPKEASDPELEDAPSPVPPAHPAGFSYSFSSDRSASQPCGCGGAPALTQAAIGLSEAGFSSYEGSITGSITDAGGQAGWFTEFGIKALPDQLIVDLRIETPSGVSYYDVGAAAYASQKEPWGGWTYSYSGTYEWRSSDERNADVPKRGAFNANLTFSWVEQRLVAAIFSLDEA